jgi:hypothetical protein
VDAPTDRLSRLVAGWGMGQAQRRRSERALKIGSTMTRAFTTASGPVGRPLWAKFLLRIGVQDAR